MSQRQIAEALGISQPAVSRQLKFARDLGGVHPEVLLEAAAPILTALARQHGYSQLAVFGSVARHQARPDSDIDLLVEAPEGTSTFDFLRFKSLVEQVLGREVDLVSCGGLKPLLDDDIRREAVPSKGSSSSANPQPTTSSANRKARAATRPWPLTTNPSRSHHDAEVETTHLMHAVSGAASSLIVVTKCAAPVRVLERGSAAPNGVEEVRHDESPQAPARTDARVWLVRLRVHPRIAGPCPEVVFAGLPPTGMGAAPRR